MFDGREVGVVGSQPDLTGPIVCIVYICTHIQRDASILLPAGQVLLKLMPSEAESADDVDNCFESPGLCEANNDRGGRQRSSSLFV